MAFLLRSSPTLTGKTEGTSQTYGQMISIVSDGDIVSTSTPDGALVIRNSPIAPIDTVVRIIPNDVQMKNLGTSFSLTDTDRSKISISAFSDSKDPTVAINRRETSDNVSLEGSSLNSFSTVGPNDAIRAVVLGSQIKSREDIKQALIEAQKIDMMITLKSKPSEDIEFNNLKEINPDIQFVYNFFSDNEEDIQSQEDQSQDPLLKKDIFSVPRYVKLNWNSAKITDELTDTERTPSSRDTEDLKRKVFELPRGTIGFASTNFKDSFEKSKKDTFPISKDGVNMQIVDIHKPDLAINSTSNKNMFSNTFNAVFNTTSSKNVINTLPVLLGLKR